MLVVDARVAMDSFSKGNPLYNTLNKRVLIRRHDIMSPNDNLFKIRRLFENFDWFSRLLLLIRDLYVFV